MPARPRHCGHRRQRDLRGSPATETIGGTGTGRSGTDPVPAPEGPSSSCGKQNGAKREPCQVTNIVVTTVIIGSSSERVLPGTRRPNRSVRSAEARRLRKCSPTFLPRRLSKAEHRYGASIATTGTPPSAGWLARASTKTRATPNAVALGLALAQCRELLGVTLFIPRRANRAALCRGSFLLASRGRPRAGSNSARRSHRPSRS